MTPLVHRALLYGGQDDILDVTVPFLRSGLESGEAILAVIPSVHIEALRDTFGDDAEAMTFIDAADWYEHPVRTVAAYNDFVHEAAPRRVRALAEPIWHGRSPVQTVEWQRYESVVNVAFTGFGAQVICLYDKVRLDSEIISAALRTHPEVADGGRPGSGAARSSDAFVDPAAFNAECDSSPLPPPAGAVESLPIAREDDLHELRAFVTERARRHRQADASLSNLLVAVTEIATNALRHGTPPVTLRVWAEDTDLVCEVADHGQWDRHALLGFLPPKSATAGGFGLWAARMLVDVAQVRSGGSGTVVRLHTAL
ncbi:sensor histidine kinase [Actinomadura sp. HBU206391]|uniref:sensor histidine kinase n=1 Tax=Actinomadura sp. HBU206391 TaxID=2731692 RepID=UPI0016500680|nr:sensor histidine kinase [Actinomadura sp. HBU206391]MBC6457995.1 sensor histidine kinase [Actinomadura sp. HBU206391]